MGDFIFLQVVSESKNQLIEYIGTTRATDFRRTSRPVQLASQPLEVPIKFRILDGMNSKG
jgi:hypothetical protein